MWPSQLLGLWSALTLSPKCWEPEDSWRPPRWLNDQSGFPWVASAGPIPKRSTETVIWVSNPPKNEKPLMHFLPKVEERESKSSGGVWYWGFLLTCQFRLLIDSVVVWVRPITYKGVTVHVWLRNTFTGGVISKLAGKVLEVEQVLWKCSTPRWEPQWRVP